MVLIRRLAPEALEDEDWSSDSLDGFLVSDGHVSSDDDDEDGMQSSPVLGAPYRTVGRNSEEGVIPCTPPGVDRHTERGRGSVDSTPPPMLYNPKRRCHVGTSSQSSDDSSVCRRKRRRPAAPIASAVKTRKDFDNNQREWSASHSNLRDFQLALKSTFELVQAGLEALKEISDFVEDGVRGLEDPSYIKETDVLEAARALQGIARFGSSEKLGEGSSGTTTRSPSTDGENLFQWKRSGRQAFKVGKTT